MKQDKFLTGILIAIGALILLALALFFLRQDKRDYVSEASPSGIVHNYVLAVINRDYEKAYGYLADLQNKPTYEEFRQSFFNGAVSPQNVGVDVGDANITGDTADVSLTVYYAYSDPFSSRSGSSDHASLVRQNGDWKISYMPYNFWNYSWYQEPYKP